MLEGIDFNSGVEDCNREQTKKLVPNSADVIIEEIEGEDEDESFDQAQDRKVLEKRNKMRTTSFKEVKGKSSAGDQ